ncbi:MAG: hypothetical protein EXR29_09920 [Betaproteobacteria bacterium]|nr:hypothetical protein [Betaproteobacteria bacterium]
MNNPARLPIFILFFVVAGCSTNPVTGREQIFALPAVLSAHADLAFAVSTGAQRFASAQSCAEPCRDEVLLALFSVQVRRLGAELAAAARILSPELFARIDAFQIGVDDDLGMASGSSAGGRIALGAGLARFEPRDNVTAFLIAREMAHVIARHDEEDSGARLFSSGFTALLPGYSLITRLFASTVGSGALMRSWAAAQRREADEIAVALLEVSGRPAAEVAIALANGLRRDMLTRQLRTNALRETEPRMNESWPDTDWAERYFESAERVALLADLPPRYAEYGN